MSEFRIRRFCPQDADAVISCIHEVFGDDYYHKNAYDKDFLIRSNQDESYRLFVAYETEGEAELGFAGVIGLRDSPLYVGGIEISMEIVRPSCRHRGLGYALQQAATDAALSHPITALYGHNVTFNDSSQKLMTRIGYLPTGFWFSRYRSDLAFLTVKQSSPKLHSLVMVKPHMKTSCGTLYVRKELGAFTDTVYHSLGLSPARCETLSIPQAEVSRIDVDFSADYHNCDIYVRLCGTDFCQRIQEIVEQYAPWSLITYTIFLNVLDSSAVYAYDRLRDFGFSFTGYHPMDREDEYMMLHKGNGAYIVPGELALLPPAQALLSELTPFWDTGRS